MKHFVQFYAEQQFLHFDSIPFTNLYNGISHVWKFIDERGWKHHWVSNALPGEPPITEGELWASCWTNTEFNIVLEWAKNYTDLDVHFCGPIIHYDATIDSLPNCTCHKGNAGDILFEGRESEWKLEVPKHIQGPIGYAFSILKNRGCVWGKCNFCCRGEDTIYREVDEIPIVEHPYHKYIWIYTYAITREIMHKLYPKLPDRDDVTYESYIRADQQAISAYKDVLKKLKVDPKYFAFDIGLEFPGDRMLSFMNKGSTTKHYLEFIELATKLGNKLHFNFILNWNNITKLDVTQLKKFFINLGSVTSGDNITIDIFPLYLMTDRPIFHEFDKKDLVLQKRTKWRNLEDWDIELYCCRLEGKQKDLNKECEDIVSSFPFHKVRNHIPSYTFTD